MDILIKFQIDFVVEGEEFLPPIDVGSVHMRKRKRTNKQNDG